MDYIELNIPVESDEQGEMLLAGLSDFPFEGFEQAPGMLKAYIPSEALPGCKTQVDALLEGLGAKYIHIEATNWNALWESNFEPVEVGERLRIRAPFHAPKAVGLEVVIMPQMSFGTGHHATTRLMAGALLDLDVRGRRVLDMGSGSGVLAIIAARRGAASIDAVDIDAWAYDNARENVAANGVSERVFPLLGDVSAIAGRRYDLILANINLNVLLRDMAAYKTALEPDGALVVSGILTSDVETLKAHAGQSGLHPKNVYEESGWACIELNQRK